MRQHLRFSLGWLLLAAAAASPAAAQIYQRDPFGEARMPTLSAPSVELPRLTFKLAHDIALPGPLRGDAPRVTDEGLVEVPVSSGMAVTSLGAGAVAVVRPWPDPQTDDEGADESPWVYADGGKRRFRTEDSGLLVAEKCCSWFGGGWHRAWKVRIPAGAVVPPLVSGPTVFVGALDNQVYAIRARNGHRLWAADLGQRVTRPLAVWSQPAPPDDRRGSRKPRKAEIRLVLVALNGGSSSSLLALDAGSGGKVATFELPESEGWIVGSPATTAGGEVVVARQKYAESDATLMVFRLEPPGAAVPQEPAADAAAGGS